MQPMTGRHKVFAPAAAGITARADENPRFEATLSQTFANAWVAVATLHARLFEAALLAAKRRINRHALPHVQALHSFPYRFNCAKKLMSRDNGQLKIRLRRRHWFVLQKAKVAAANAGDFAFDDNP